VKTTGFLKTIIHQHRTGNVVGLQVGKSQNKACGFRVLGCGSSWAPVRHCTEMWKCISALSTIGQTDFTQSVLDWNTDMYIGFLCSHYISPALKE
jgi:hypothetical protein